MEKKNGKKNIQSIGNIYVSIQTKQIARKERGGVEDDIINKSNE